MKQGRARLLRLGSWLGLTAVLLGMASVPAWAAAPGSFQLVGPMTVVRHIPTLTLLADGSVLVTGGETNKVVPGLGYVGTASTERFDPKTNQFVADAPMSVARENHSAALLPDGRVLVLGGIDDKYRILASAEVYDPATKTFTRVGDLVQRRWGATATALLDGRVLVAGGLTSLTATTVATTAELFDPATGKFQQTGTMAIRRIGHTAVRLSDGRVALMGGAPQVEIYDPKTAIFSTLGETTARNGAAIISVPGDKILLAGGWWGSVDFDSIEIYDPATGQTAVTSHLSAPRSGAASVSLADGRILMAGGWSGGTHAKPVASAVAELIDPVTGQASPAAMLAKPRPEGVAILLLDGRALIAGAGDAVVGKTAEVYVPAAPEEAAPGG